MPTEDNSAHDVSGPVTGSVVGVATEDNPAYGVSIALVPGLPCPRGRGRAGTEARASHPVTGSDVGVVTEDNPAYGVGGRHRRGGQTEQMYELPRVIQPQPASQEPVYAGVD